MPETASRRPERAEPHEHAGRAEQSDHVRSRVRDRNSRRILAAVSGVVEADGIEHVSMRRLADTADVSVRTLYNLFDDRNGLIRALVLDSIADVNLAVGTLRAIDPIERAWEAVEVAMTTVVSSLSRNVLAPVLDDPELLLQLSQQWNVRDVLVAEIGSARAARDLHDDIDAGLLVDHVGMALLVLLREWAGDLIDDDALVAGTLHALDVCLLAVATNGRRDEIRDHALALAPRLVRPVPL